MSMYEYLEDREAAEIDLEGLEGRGGGIEGDTVSSTASTTTTQLFGRVGASLRSIASTTDGESSVTGSFGGFSSKAHSMSQSAAAATSSSSSSTTILSRKHRLAAAQSQLSEPLTASTSGPTDPFYIFRDDLERKMQSMDEYLAEYLRLVHQTDTAVYARDVSAAHKALKRRIKSAESAWTDVRTAVSLAAANPNNHNHNNSSSRDSEQRTTWVETAYIRINRAKSDAASPSIRAKLLADERASRRRRMDHHTQENDPPNGTSHHHSRPSNTTATPTPISSALAAEHDKSDMNGIANNNNHNNNSQTQTSLLLLRRQDETLDELDLAVERVGHIAVTIGDEVAQQNKMLDDITEDLSNAEEELGLVMGKLAKLLQTKNSWHLRTILTLSLIVFVLFFLVLYT